MSSPISQTVVLFALGGLSIAFGQLAFIVVRQYIEATRKGGDLVDRTRPVKRMLLVVGLGSLLTLPLPILLYALRAAHMPEPDWLNDAAVAVRVTLVIITVNVAFAAYMYKWRKQL